MYARLAGDLGGIDATMSVAFMSEAMTIPLLS